MVSPFLLRVFYTTCIIAILHSKVNLMKFKLVLLCLFTTWTFKASSQSVTGADSARNFIDSALSFARHNSVYRNKLNWTAITDSVKTSSTGAKSILEAMPAMAQLYRLTGDYHGFVLYRGKYYKWWRPSKKTDTTVHKVLEVKFKMKPLIEQQLLEKGYGYLSIPRNNPNHAHQTDTIANQIQDSLAKLTPARLKGLIIDLRLNSGGSMFPMILGIGNIIDKGKQGSFYDPASQTSTAWGVKGLDIYVGNDTKCSVLKFCTVNPAIKVVVLISPKTASSGEATAISLKGQKNVYFIGETTGGFTTANDSIDFTNDLSAFFATAVEADRNDKLYYDNVLPDKEIIGGDNFNDLHKDAKVIAALQWLKQK